MLINLDNHERALLSTALRQWADHPHTEASPAETEALRARLENGTAAEKPILGICIEGGLVQDLLTTRPDVFDAITLLVIDFDPPSDLDRPEVAPVELPDGRVRQAAITGRDARREFIDLGRLAGSAAAEPGGGEGGVPSISGDRLNEHLHDLRAGIIRRICELLEQMPERRVRFPGQGVRTLGPLEEDGPHVEMLERAGDGLKAEVYLPGEPVWESWDTGMLQEMLGIEAWSRLLTAVEELRSASSTTA